ncbi:hypothetical protein [Phormidium tenue]|nr:hypothetical protein [Phormidium tenue]MBD2230057.1 hypothetical protein [Phormidium tenue FACHB-1052]
MLRIFLPQVEQICTCDIERGLQYCTETRNKKGGAIAALTVPAIAPPSRL